MRDAQSKRNNREKLGTTDWKARSLYGWLLVRQNFHAQSSFTPHNYASSLILFHNGHSTKFTTAQNDEISSQLTRVEHMSNISVSSSFRSHEKDSTTSHSLNSLIQKSSSNYIQPTKCSHQNHTILESFVSSPHSSHSQGVLQHSSSDSECCQQHHRECCNAAASVAEVCEAVADSVAHAVRDAGVVAGGNGGHEALPLDRLLGWKMKGGQTL